MSGDYKVVHEELNRMIGLFDEKVDKMVEKHEKDYLSAFRVSFKNILIFYRAI